MTFANLNKMGDLILVHSSQLIDITGKDQDESMIALHDSNGDVNKAINVLLEGSPDTVSICVIEGQLWRNLCHTLLSCN